MIGGGAEKIEKKNFEGPSPGKKISRGPPGKKKAFARKKKFKKGFREEKNSRPIFSPPPPDH